MTASTVTGSLATSASVHPRGWTSPSNPMARHPHQVPVAPVLGGAVHALAGVAVEQVGELVLGRAAGLLLARGSSVGEPGPQGGQPLAVALLEPDHRTVELPLGQAAGALDAGPPGELVEGVQGVELANPPLAAVAGPRSGRPPRSAAGRR